MEFLITTIVAVILLVGVVSSCPHHCSCSAVPSDIGVRFVVHCDSKGLYHIPIGFPSDTYALSLNNNDISKIEENAFNNLPNLTYLYMKNNPITFVNGKAFVNLPQLKKLDFSMNCGDCDTIPFWRWLRLDQRTGIKITCNDFHGTQLSSLQQNDFTGCSDVPTVQVQQPSYSVTTGNSVTLVCTVSSDLTITNVQWQRNISGSITTINSNTNTNKYNGSTTTIPSLTIFSAASSDVGTYTCFASNSVGTGQSTTTTLSVTGRQSTTTTLSVTGNVFIVQLEQGTTTTLIDTGRNDGKGSVWCSRQSDWKWLVYMFFMISLQYIMSNI